MSGRNRFGLHDMVGNVWEWTSSHYCVAGACAADTMVIRGGSWAFSARMAQCGRRYVHAPKDSGYSIGFRLVRELRK